MGELLPTPDGTLSSVMRVVTMPNGVKDSKEVLLPTEWQVPHSRMRQQAIGSRRYDCHCGPVVLTGGGNVLAI